MADISDEMVEVAKEIFDAWSAQTPGRRDVSKREMLRAALTAVAPMLVAGEREGLKMNRKIFEVLRDTSGSPKKAHEINDALEAAGYRVVPRVSTERMLEAGQEVLEKGYTGDGRYIITEALLAEAFDAMIAAALSSKP